MRTLCCLTGQATVYEQAGALLEQLGGISISGMQIQRVCLHYGQQFDPLIRADCQAILPPIDGPDPQEPVYVMVDGSMVLTREEQWREMKLARIFTGPKVVELSSRRRAIRHSVYLSHLGGVEAFLPKLERHLTQLPGKVILGDGARWIWNWAEDNYPGAVQILDFYHAKEKLVLFARHQFGDEDRRRNWIKQQADRLLNNELESVLATVRSCRARNGEASRAKSKLLDYYIEHDDRMQYKTYRDQGLLIGSGPIEAAHRSVIQQRMKLSGQKWSISGAQAIANLRCYRASQAWHLVEKVIAAAA